MKWPVLHKGKVIVCCFSSYHNVTDNTITLKLFWKTVIVRWYRYKTHPYKHYGNVVYRSRARDGLKLAYSFCIICQVLLLMIINWLKTTPANYFRDKLNFIQTTSRRMVLDQSRYLRSLSAKSPNVIKPKIDPNLRVLGGLMGYHVVAIDNNKQLS